jgi:Leu/Phe-tRNA-protein transferase
MPISRFADWDSFLIAPGATDSPVAFCADLSPGSVLSAYRHGIVPFPAATEYLRDVNEFRYEDEVDAGLIGLVGDDDPYWAAWWCPDPRPLIGVGEVHPTSTLTIRSVKPGSASAGSSSPGLPTP